MSPPIFVIAAEVMALCLRQSNKIKGISFKGEEMLISQFADNTILTLRNNKKNIINSMNFLKLL